MRTTIMLHPSLYRRLKLFAHGQGKPVSEVVETAIRKTIEAQEKSRIQRMYTGLFQLAGTARAGVQDAASSIDEALYGASGAWKGEDD